MNKMSIKSNKELLFAHATLHEWANNGYRNKPRDWTIAGIRREHARLVKIMQKRNIPHSSPIP